MNACAAGLGRFGSACLLITSAHLPTVFVSGRMNLSGRHSDRAAKRGKGHYCAGLSKATGGRVWKKVTHLSGRHSDRAGKREKGHHCAGMPKATRGLIWRKVTHLSGKHSDRGAKREKGHASIRKAQRQRREKRERSRILPESAATEARKERKVTHPSGKRSDRGGKREKGHASFRKAQRQRSKKRERSRIFPDGAATGEQKKRKVTHLSGKQIILSCYLQQNG